ncbi:hypothetical protein RvY_01703 [Ramazzottius varieornatus]|uniref:Uncharacterized protein n=1 Tax=Ramazzottius varieornatus TaxID=947166 RepID=A0A1D1UN85_RAMVA|nr:hypothetical protein RvY_01703 [Ramazzottius varieornatus]
MKFTANAQTGANTQAVQIELNNPTAQILTTLVRKSEYLLNTFSTIVFMFAEYYRPLCVYRNFIGWYCVADAGPTNRQFSKFQNSDNWQAMNAKPQKGELVVLIFF